MRLRSKRLVSLLLAGSMMVSMVPASAVTAFAAETNGIVSSADAAEEVPTVEVSTSGGLEAAVKEKYTNLDEITSLVVRGGPLNAADFQFLSGVVVTGDAGTSCTAEYAGAVNASEATKKITYLKNLETLDLTDAQCENNTFPPRAFCGNTKIEVVIFPNTLVDSGWKTFSMATGLTYVGTREGKTQNKIIFPTSMTTIGESSFWGTSELNKEVELPENLTSLGSGAFQGSGVSGKIKINGNVTFEKETGKTANVCDFKGTKISSVEFGDGILEIPAFFAESAPVKEIIIPNSVTTIGKSAFYHLDNNNFETFDKDLVVPKNVSTIGEYAFYHAGNINNIIVENPDVLLNHACFAYLTTKIYFKSVQTGKDASNFDCWSNTATILNTDGGEVIPNSAETYESTGLYTPTKEGYKFNGWYNGTTKLKGAAQAGYTYTAKWTADTYTVAVDYAGKSGTNYETAVTYPNTMDEPKHEDVDGYTFGGWYDGNTKVTFPLKVTANTTLTAKWYLNATKIEPAAACKVTVENGTAWIGDQQVEFVAPGETVTIKANQDIVDGMKFSHWEVRKGKVELANAELDETTFVMPAEPVEVAVMLKDESSDDGIDAATVVTGVAIGAGAAVLTYHIGTELYAEQVLGKGVAVPKTRADVALKAWELAGKPAVAIDGEPLSEAAQAEKWAVESGLMQNDAEGNFNGTKKMNKLKALRVLDKAQKMG